MQWTVPQLPATVPVAYYVVASIVAVLVGMVQFSERPSLSAFPAIGSNSWIGSWWAGIKFVTNAADAIRDGYKEHKGTPFKIATLYYWIVILTGRAHIEELRNARNDEFSFMDAVNQDVNIELTMGPEVVYDPYHIAVIRSQLSRNIRLLHPELYDEIITAFEDTLGLKNNEWKSVPALSTVQQIVCRASNRSFVGLPLCRNSDFIALNIQYTIDAIKGGILIGLFPKFLRPLVARFVTNVPRNTARGLRHLRPIIEERQKYLNEYGKDWTEKPHDFLTWIMDERGPDATVEDLTNRILVTNFASIHTSASVFTSALYNLAANPQYVRPLREEVDGIVESEGWSSMSLNRMHRVDSFLKESARMEGVDILGMMRKAKKDYTFSDGTLIPKGTRVNAGLMALHYDDTLYENPEVFNPFRFSDMRQEDEEGAKHQFVVTSPEYLLFGHGQHACPGRFFAAAELKTMLAHMVVTYDIKLEDNMTRPQSLRIGSSIAVNSTAKVMFRKRAREEGNGH